MLDMTGYRQTKPNRTEPETQSIPVPFNPIILPITHHIVIHRVTAEQARRLLLSLEVVKEDRALLRLLTPVLDDDARAVDNLAGVTLTVELACEPVSPIHP